MMAAGVGDAGIARGGGGRSIGCRSSAVECRGSPGTGMGSQGKNGVDPHPVGAAPQVASICAGQSAVYLQGPQIQVGVGTLKVHASTAKRHLKHLARWAWVRGHQILGTGRSVRRVSGLRILTYHLKFRL